ncbi:hypothetical protein NXY15_00445 [Bacteroides thetaiotaomicron]|nr:hypothetical protein NXY15_00445 [Bacteroides thetaiotaomicron]
MGGRKWLGDRKRCGLKKETAGTVGTDKGDFHLLRRLFKIILYICDNKSKDYDTT